MAEYEEKTEAATPRKRQEEREKGHVARSNDLTAAVTLLGGVILLRIFGGRLMEAFAFIIQRGLSGDGSAGMVETADVGHDWTTMVMMGAEALLPLAVGLAVLAVAVNLLQVGFVISPKALEPSFSKLSPMKGLSNLFSKRGLMRMLMSMGKVALVSAVAVASIWYDMDKVHSLAALAAGPALKGAATLVYATALRVAVVLVIIAILDFAYQKWQYEQDLKMTKQEAKEEYKRMEGDPLVKQRRAKVARQLAMQRIARDVPRADVVVTNPTHYAVALEYDGDRMNAPRVVAKGADFLALRIRQIAMSHQIPIVERKELARALYREVEVGQEIPPAHFAAVAEILAYVYRLSGKRSA